MNNKIEKGGFYQITFTDLTTLKDFLKYKRIHAFQLRYDSLFGAYSYFCTRNQCTYVIESKYNDDLKLIIKNYKILSKLKQ